LPIGHQAEEAKKQPIEVLEARWSGGTDIATALAAEPEDLQENAARSSVSAEPFGLGVCTLT